jgi:hypothetical protein
MLKYSTGAGGAARNWDANPSVTGCEYLQERIRFRLVQLQLLRISRVGSCVPMEDPLMTRRAKVWLVVADIFAVVNLAGAGIAAAQGELLHTTVHLGLLGLGLYMMWRVGTVRRGQEPAHAVLDAARLEQLQQSVDAIALEVERIGESQRFNAKLQAERIEKPR